MTIPLAILILPAFASLAPAAVFLSGSRRVTAGSGGAYCYINPNDPAAGTIAHGGLSINGQVETDTGSFNEEIYSTGGGTVGGSRAWQDSFIDTDGFTISRMGAELYNGTGCAVQSTYMDSTGYSFFIWSFRLTEPATSTFSGVAELIGSAPVSTIRLRFDTGGIDVFTLPAASSGPFSLHSDLFAGDYTFEISLRYQSPYVAAGVPDSTNSRFALRDTAFSIQPVPEPRLVTLSLMAGVILSRQRRAPGGSTATQSIPSLFQATCIPTSLDAPPVKLAVTRSGMADYAPPTSIRTELSARCTCLTSAGGRRNQSRA